MQEELNRMEVRNFSRIAAAGLIDQKKLMLLWNIGKLLIANILLIIPSAA
jgi:hypothetical protein